MFLSDLLRRNALVEATFEAWATLAYHKAMTKAAFRTWSRETTPPLELDWDVIEASHSLTQEQLDQLGFRQLNFDVTDRIDWQDFVAVGETEQQEYQTVSQHEHWSPWGPMSPKGTFTPAGLQHLLLTVPTPTGTFDGNGSTEGLLRVPSRKGICNDQRRRRALQAWRKVVQERKQEAAEASDSEHAHYDDDSDGGSGSDSSDDDHDGDDQHHHRHNPVMAAGIQSFPAASKADHLTRPMRPDSFGRILRKLFEGQQPLPWAPHPLSAFMNTEAYRRFNYCTGSGEYKAFEVSGNAAVYLASFTANAPPGVRLWLVDSGLSCFVTPFRDTMILPIRTELQMNGIGGAQSRMVSPLILSFLDADGKYTVLHFQWLFVLETLPIPLFATGPCEQQDGDSA
jgi:hypothetical protein